MIAVEVELSDPAPAAVTDALFEECPGALIQQSTYWPR